MLSTQNTLIIPLTTACNPKSFRKPFGNCLLPKIFGDHAGVMAISSTQSMTGHLLGASGAIEAIATILAIRHGIVPPTINYETPDPDCDLHYTPNTAIERTVDVALSNTFGFGGHNAVLVAKAYNGE